MKNFIHHNFQDLKRIDSEAGRVYETPSGKRYPSVTAVTGLQNIKSIMEWRERVGEQEANRVSTRASNRGTRIHKLCEDYLKGIPNEPNMFDLEMYKSLVPHLDRINNIHALESKLYSDHLQVAGTVDCVAEYDGKLAVIDFKTASRVKEKSEILNYFMQTSAYAVAFEERTGIPVSRMIVIMGVDDNEPLLFVEKRDNWIDSFIQLREDYRKWKNL